MDLSVDYLGASTVIIQTIPIQNNVQDLDELVAVNRRIWEYAREFEANMTTKEDDENKKSAPNLPRRKILVMDLYSLSVASYLQNSMEIGIFRNDTGKDLQSKLFLKSIDDPFHFLNLTMALKDSIKDYTIPHRKHFTHGKISKNSAGEILHRKVGQSCGDINCTIPSSITRDGQHWCMDQFAGRLNAGLACLVQCSLLNNNGEELPANSKTMRDCERSCNGQYMSLVPVRWENAQKTIVNGTTFDSLENYTKP